VCAVLVSAVPGCFLAGADLNLVSRITDAAEAQRLSADIQRLMNGIEDMPMPTIAISAYPCVSMLMTLMVSM
jgi:enoyl-CoA hydratase/carnithine racemase